MKCSLVITWDSITHLGIALYRVFSSGHILYTVVLYSWMVTWTRESISPMKLYEYYVLGMCRVCTRWVYTRDRVSAASAPLQFRRIAFFREVRHPWYDLHVRDWISHEGNVSIRMRASFNDRQNCYFWRSRWNLGRILLLHRPLSLYAL